MDEKIEELKALINDQMEALEECYQTIEAEYGKGPSILRTIEELRERASKLLEDGGAGMSALTQLTYHNDTDTYQANAAGYQITVSREAFEKLRRIYINEFVKCGMAEIPDAFQRAQEFVLIAEYWIGDKNREGVSIVALSQ